jgi:uncharacterized protein
VVHRLGRVEARRVAVRAQGLDAERPVGLVPLVERLTLLQLDPTAAVAPSADLVAWSRLGGGYEPAHLRAALEEDRSLFEHAATVRPVSDLPLFLAGMARAPGWAKARDWLAANPGFRADVLARLRAEGPLLSRDVPDTSQVPWPSTGWTNNRNVTQMLEILAARGEVAIAGRRGKQRVWDVADRVYPAVTPVPYEAAQRTRAERRLRALGLVREGAAPLLGDPVGGGEVGEPAEIEGVPGRWRVDPAALGLPFEGRTALLSPFDRLVHDRARALDLFGFEYVLEMYKPAASRRWGYFALPVLHGDRLVGKADVTADRKAGVLRVAALHEDEPVPVAAVRAELADLATWLGLDWDGRIGPPT